MDPETQKAVHGLTLMNEPAHTNAWSHFAEEQNVLTWLSETSGDFRTSSLPAANVKLYVNLIETAFSAFEHSAVPWFLQTFTKEEQKTWACCRCALVCGMEQRRLRWPLCGGWRFPLRCANAAGQGEVAPLCEQRFSASSAPLRRCAGLGDGVLSGDFSQSQVCMP